MATSTEEKISERDLFRFGHISLGGGRITKITAGTQSSCTIAPKKGKGL